MGFPGRSDGKKSACSAGDPGSIPGSGRSPGEGKWQYSCQECQGQSSPAGYSPWGHKESDTTEQRSRSASSVLLIKLQMPLQDVCEPGLTEASPSFLRRGEPRAPRASGVRRYPSQAGSEGQIHRAHCPPQHSRSAAVQGTSLYPSIPCPRLILALSGVRGITAL